MDKLRDYKFGIKTNMLETLKTVLDVLVASGRLMYYTKGTVKTVKELAIIGLKLYNCTVESHRPSISKEDIEDEL